MANCCARRAQHNCSGGEEFAALRAARSEREQLRKRRSPVSAAAAAATKVRYVSESSKSTGKALSLSLSHRVIKGKKETSESVAFKASSEQKIAC